jgi:hypothetical protein
VRGRAARLTVGALALALLCAGGSAPPARPELGNGFVMRAGIDAGFLSLPWPNDVRVTAGGSLDLSGLPGVGLDPWGILTLEVPLESVALGRIVASAEGTVGAFGLNSAVFMQSSVPIDPGTLPDPKQSIRDDSPVVLIELDTGTRTPVLVEFVAAGHRFQPANTLVVRPAPGHPLRPSTRYALAVLEGVRGADGSALEPAALIGELDEAWHRGRGGSAATWRALRRQRDLVRAAVRDHTGHGPDALLAFTVFSTQDTHAEMRAVAASLDASAEPTLEVGSTVSCETDERADGRRTARVDASILVPRFQHGSHPYLLRGGDLRVVDGVASPSGTTRVPVSIRVPCGDPPPSGWPAVGYIDGTGAGGDVDASLHPFGFADRVVAQIPPLHSGATTGDVGFWERRLLDAVGVDDTNLSALLFFNLLNPVAARSNVIQQAAQHLALLGALAELTASFEPTPGAVLRVDPTRIVAAGHSQGAQTLPLVAAFATDLAAVVSSSGSGGYSHQFAHAADKRDLLARLTGDPDTIDERSLLVHVAQTVLDAVDPANYPSTVPYLNVSGRLDGCVAVESARHLAVGLGLATVRPGGTSATGTDATVPWGAALPAFAEPTAASRLNVETDGGHYVALFDPAPATSFLEAVDAGAVPAIPERSYENPDPDPGCGGRVP